MSDILTPDACKAADLRNRARAVREQAAKLRRRAQTAPGAQGGYLAIQATMLEDGAAAMEADALRIDPPRGEA